MGSPRVRLLLDTHIFLWALLEPERLSQKVRRALSNPETEVWLSPVSLWETLLLAERGRLQLQEKPEQWIRSVLKSTPLREAPLNFEIALLSHRLDINTEDPADRFIAATAKVFDCALVTADRNLQKSKQIRVLAN